MQNFAFSGWVLQCLFAKTCLCIYQNLAFYAQCHSRAMPKYQFSGLFIANFLWRNIGWQSTV